MVKRQFYGIKYPFTDVGDERYMLDLAENVKEKARSEVLHYIMTPKGQRIRKPDFGSDIIKFIFDVNDELTWTSVEENIKEGAKKWLPGISIKKVSIEKDENNPLSVNISANYTINLGFKTIEDTAITKI